MSMEDHMQRSLLASGYEALEVVGEGAYGIVW
jgi:mitogen-activated protein kinase 1/3